MRATAARIVSAVAHEGVALDTALEQYREKTPESDRAILQAICYETVRWYPRLASIAADLLDRPLKRRDRLVEALILVGLCQLEYLRVPPHAAVAETVQATRKLRQPRAAGLVNAVLRRFQRERAERLAVAEATDAGLFAAPDWLIGRLRRDWPQDWRRILEASNAHPPMWLRVNRGRIDRADYRARLLEETGVDSVPGACSPAALKLARPLDVHRLPGFAEGLVSVQDAAAQLASARLRLEPGMRVLDACAAPGGKTCDILESGVAGLTVTALDNSRRRLAKVNDNLQRLNLQAEVVVGDACRPDTWWDGQLFDRILIDAPCSATGVIRRHPDIKLLRRESDIAALARGQTAMIAALWPLLAAGGRLVYATCSVLTEENADVVSGFLKDQRGAIAATGDDKGLPWGRPAGPGRQILTGEAGMDGFYYACVEQDQPASAEQ